MGFESYKGSIKLGAGLTPASEGYPLMQSYDIQVDEDGKTLAEYIEEQKENFPEATSADEGKVLAVVNGKWEIAICPVKDELTIAIDNKVPKTLSVLTQIQSGQFETDELRGLARMYVDVDNTPYYATLEQLKQLNTKTVCVDALTDEKINTLSNGDIILLEERK